MGLTAKQERFAILAATHTQHEAYVLAYDAENMSPAVIDNEASLLAKHSEVSVRIAEEKALALAPIRASAEWIVFQAAAIVESDEPASARVSALALLAKRHPEFSDKVDARVLHGVVNVERATRSLTSESEQPAPTEES